MSRRKPHFKSCPSCQTTMQNPVRVCPTCSHQFYEAYTRAGQPGDTNGRSKLTADDVRSIRERHASGTSPQLLAAEYGVHKRTVQAVSAGDSWSWLD